MLATEHLWPIINACANVSLCPHIKYFRSDQLIAFRSFLHLTNVSLKHRYVCFHCSILLYTFVVFHVEHMWRLQFTTCTVKLHKPLVSLWFHCQWNHQNCTASIPTHCPCKFHYLELNFFFVNVLVCSSLYYIPLQNCIYTLTNMWL